MRGRLRVLGIGLLLLIMAGCATQPHRPVEPARIQLADVAPPGTVFPIQVYDPLETVNRGIYTFNAAFDRFIFLPVVRGYQFVTPVFVQNRISDFFINITEFRNFTNSVLQFNGERAGRAALRFVINVMFGFGGLYDIASAKDIPQQPEDFGETLGHWGVGDGPYLVLPLLGPSNARDATGLVVDAAALTYALPAEVTSSIAYYALMYGVRPIDARARVAFRYYGSGSPFEYDLVRFLITEKRNLDIQR